MSLMWSVGIVGLMVVMFVFWFFTRKAQRVRKEAEQTLMAKFSHTNPPILRLTIGSSYGYPHFTVVFRATADLEQAKESGLCQHIQMEIERFANDTRFGGAPFDPSVGIFYTTSAG